MKENKLLSKMKIQFAKAAFSAAFVLIGLTASAQWSETFDNTTLPTGWANYPSGGGSTASNAYWKFSGFLGYGMSGTQDHTGNGGTFAWVDGSSPYGQAAHLATDSINLVGYTNPHLEFWMKRNNTTNTTRQVLHIDVWNGTAWVYDVLVQQANTVNGDWERFQVNIDTVSIISETSIRFRLWKQSGNFYDDVAIDDIAIISIVDDDAGATAVVNPVLPACSLDTVVVAEIKNFGGDSLLTAMVNWSINGALQTPVSWSDTLEPGATTTVSLTNTASLSFGDTITVWTTMPNGVVDVVTMNDTTEFYYIAGLSGVKTIDPSGAGDFLSFTEAIQNLENYGVCGNLVIEAVNGTYVEQIDIKTYDGMSNMSTVTFTSQSGIADSVILSFSSTSTADNYVLKLVDADYFTFENITIENIGTNYSSVIYFYASDSLEFSGCNIVSNGTSYNSYNIRGYNYVNGAYAASTSFKMTNSKIVGGYYGFYYSGYNAIFEDAVITNNQFLNQVNRSVNIATASNLIFNDNYFTSNSTYTYGYFVSLSTIDGGEIKRNYLKGTATFPRVGMNLYKCSGGLSNFMPISNNRIYIYCILTKKKK